MISDFGQEGRRILNFMDTGTIGGREDRNEE